MRWTSTQIVETSTEETEAEVKTDPTDQEAKTETDLTPETIMTSNMTMREEETFSIETIDLDLVPTEADQMEATEVMIGTIRKTTS